MSPLYSLALLLLLVTSKCTPFSSDNFSLYFKDIDRNSFKDSSISNSPPPTPPAPHHHDDKSDSDYYYDDDDDYYYEDDSYYSETPSDSFAFDVRSSAGRAAAAPKGRAMGMMGRKAKAAAAAAAAAIPITPDFNLPPPPQVQSDASRISKDKKYRIPEEEFFTDYYPPSHPNGDPMTVEEWIVLREELIAKWNERSVKTKTTRPLPLCVKGDFDPTAGGFIKSGALDQHDADEESEDGTSHILKADKNGRTEGGILKSIEFFSIHSPENKAKKKEEGAGIGRLNQWLHIVLQTERPVEGLFVQALMGPLGIPFGEFRTDFECKNPYEEKSQVASAGSYVIPCSVRPMAEASHPSIFLSHTCGENAGGSEITAPCPSKRDTFRFHFNWNEFQCHFVGRMQFLIIIVESFKDKSFSHIMSSTYEHSIDSLDGVAYPYFSGWSKLMRCDEKIEILTDSHESKRLTFNSTRSPFDIVINYDYDTCFRGIMESGGINLNTPASTCPPGPLGCKSKLEANGEFKAVLDLQEEQRKQTSLAGNCAVGKFCPHPDETEPEPEIIRVAEVGGGIALPPLDPTKEMEKLINAKVFFGKDEQAGAKSAFVRNVIYVKKRSSSTHGHLMILACFVLFGIGVFPARYMKETLGVDSEGEKAYLSLGRWLWFHLFSFFLSMTILWIGFSYVIRLYDSARIPCSEYTSGSLVKTYNSFKGELRKDPESLKVFHEAMKLGQNETMLITTAKDEKSKKKFGGPIRDIPMPAIDEKTALSESCEATEAAILVHQIIGFLAFTFFHVVFFFGLFIAPDTECKAIGHFAVGYGGQVLSLISIIPLLASSGFCKMVFLFGFLLFVIPFIFLAIGFVIQRQEDKARKIDDRKRCPINEGIKVTSIKTKWSKMKFGTWAALSIVIFAFYFGLIGIYEGAYESKKELEEGMEEVHCPGFSCTAPSWRIDAYIYTDYIKNISGGK